MELRSRRALLFVFLACRVAPTVPLLGPALGVYPTMSVFSKALHPSGIVWHDWAPTQFRTAFNQNRVHEPARVGAHTT